MLIFDSFVKKILSVDKIENEINVQYLASRIYFVQIILHNGISFTKKIIMK